MFYGCVLPEKQSEFDEKSQWMSKNFPNQAEYIKKINYDPKFEHAILTGQIMLKMSFDEALVAGEISPYGPNPAGKVYWCNDKLVDVCEPNCGDCRAMLVRKHEIHLFENGERGLEIVASFPNNKWPAHLTYRPSSYTSARYILRNEYAVGMEFGDIAHVATPTNTEKRYYCGDENQGRNDIPCSQGCPSCRVEIQIPRIANQASRIIELYFHNGVLDHLQQRELRPR